MRFLVGILVVVVTLYAGMGSAFAYRIVTKDESAFAFKGGNIEAESHRYQVTYEVDELSKTITALEEKDMRTGEIFPSGSVYQIVDQPTIELPGRPTAIRAYRINPRRGNIETISLCNGRYHYSKTTEDYINLFYGKYRTLKESNSE